MTTTRQPFPKPDRWYLVNVITGKPWLSTSFTTEHLVVDYLDTNIAPLHGGSWGPWTYEKGSDLVVEAS